MRSERANIGLLGTLLISLGLALAARQVGDELPQSIQVGDGNNLFLVWRVAEEPLVKCFVTTPKNKVLPLDKRGDDSQRVVYYGPGLDKGYCGAKVERVTANDIGVWTLEAHTNTGPFQSNTTVDVLAKPKPQKRIITGVSGSYLKVSCGPVNTIFCLMRSPTGHTEGVNGECTLSITAIMTAEGKWTCEYGVKGFSETFQDETAVYIMEGKTTAKLGYVETSTHVNVFCNTDDTPSYKRFCHLVTPNGTHLFLSPEQAIAKYTYYGKNSTQCGVSIPKPLKDEEYGSWLCHFQVSDLKYVGGYVTLPKTGHSLGALKLTTDNPIVFGTVGGSIKILCRINASIDYCWFRAPNGTTFTVKETGGSGGMKYLGKGLTFGDCGIELSYASRDDSGRWTCGIGTGATGMWDESETVSVVITENPVAVESLTKEASKGGSVSLSCSSLNELSLKYCRFVRPDGMGFHVQPFTNSTSYSYRGKGLAFGECGLWISSVEKHDFGRWVCAFQEISGNQFAVTVELKQSQGLSWVWISGIAIVALFVFGVLGFVAGKKQIFPKLRARLTTSETELRDPHDSNGDASASVVSSVSTVTQRSNTRRSHNYGFT